MTRGQLPQRAGSLGLNGGGAAAAVPPTFSTNHLADNIFIIDSNVSKFTTTTKNNRKNINNHARKLLTCTNKNKCD